MIIQNKRLFAMLSIAVILLLIPFVGMQFTSEVNWTASDFVVAAVLLMGTAVACETVLRMVKKMKYRIAICGAILLALLLIWAELAVGIFGSPLAGS